MATKGLGQSVHVIVHSRPSGAILTLDLQCQEWTVRVCQVSAAELREPLDVSFEQVAQQLEEQPRVFFEPDGSFVWVGQTGGMAWQIDGQLHDSARGLMTVELKFAGASVDPRPLFQLLGYPQQPLLIQLVQQGIFIETDEFFKLLAD